MTVAKPPQPLHSLNIDPVGYSELDGRPAFTMAIREVHGRWYLYAGHFWDRGWSVVDVTDLTAPHVLNFIPGPANTARLQVNLAGDTMVTALEKILPGFGGDPDARCDEGVLGKPLRHAYRGRRPASRRVCGKTQDHSRKPLDYTLAASAEWLDD